MNRRMLWHLWVWGCISLFVVFVLTSCTAPPANLPAGVLAGSVDSTPSEDADAPLAVPLVWQGYSTFGDGNTATCKSLRMSADGAVEIVPCDSDEEVLTFPGQAELDSPAWQRAIATWVEFTYGQQATGQMGSATRTVMSWWLGEIPDQPGLCRHLLVLAYGYAYANVDPCDGGAVVSTSEDWLETDELNIFDGWLYGRSPLFVENQYFEGRGTQAMTEAEIDAVTTWAEGVYQRIAGQSAPAPSPGEEIALIWEGYTAMGSADGVERCMQMSVTTGGDASVGPCGGEPTQTTTLGPVWGQIRAQFASFTLETPQVQLLFAGEGAAAGEAWQRALATWVEFTVAELSSGRVGAANRTAMSWWLGEIDEEPGICRHLIVLNYGYAYADTAPCERGQALSHEEGWLTTAEMERFDPWRSTWAPVYVEDNYFDGQGTSDATAADLDELAQWAADVYARLGK